MFSVFSLWVSFLIGRTGTVTLCLKHDLTFPAPHAVPTTELPFSKSPYKTQSVFSTLSIQVRADVKIGINREYFLGKSLKHNSISYNASKGY